MNNDEKLKILKGSKKGLIISLIVLIIGIILIVLGTNVNTKKEDVVAKDYDTLIWKKQDKANVYAKVTITYLPYLFAEETTDYSSKKYYIVFDKNNYPYIVRLTDATYNKLEKQYDNQEDISYEIKGYLFKQEKELKKLAIEGHKELFDDSEITEANYELYFGKTYLDETITPTTGIGALLIGVGVGAIIVGFIFTIIYIVYAIKLKNTIKKYSIEELESELLKSNTIYYKKQQICLTDKYIISNASGLTILKYEDILWLYYENRSINGVPIGKWIIARNNSKKRIQLAYSYAQEDVLIEIMQKIKEKNNQILLGFTKENQQQYKELTKK